MFVNSFFKVFSFFAGAKYRKISPVFFAGFGKKGIKPDGPEGLIPQTVVLSAGLLSEKNFENQKLRKQADGQRCEEIDSRMLFDKHGGEADQDNRDDNKGLPQLRG